MSRSDWTPLRHRARPASALGPCRGGTITYTVYFILYTVYYIELAQLRHSILVVDARVELTRRNVQSVKNKGQRCTLYFILYTLYR